MSFIVPLIKYDMRIVTHYNISDDIHNINSQYRKNIYN